MIDCLGSRAAVLLCFAALVAASACVQTNTASDGALDGAWAGDHDGDAGLLDDAPLTQDARVTDALGPDAHSEDVWRAEVCNGVDDDGDFRIDESTTSCTEAPHGVAAVCVEGGVCVCRPPALPTHAGTYEDCNADWSDGCETALDTEANCGACGVSCDVVSRCVDGAGGVSCRPVGIRDFSVAEPMGQITCIVTADEQLICRGPNTDFAISDAEPDTAVLDWTRVEVERPMWVRTWSRTRADGATVLLICTRHWATSDEGVGSGIVCRGDSESPFHRRYSPSARRGNVRVEDGVDIAVWRDEGYTLTLWTAPRIIRTAAPSGTWVWDAVQLQIADMPLAETASGALLTWGPHTGLAGVPTTTPVWETPMLAMVAARWIDCRGSHCCAPSVARNGVLCWRAVDGVFAQGFREVPAPALVAEDTDRNALQLAPMSDGALRACVRVGPIGGGAATTHVYCDLADDIIDRGAEASLTEHPELVGRAGWGPRSRSDWYAMCVQEAEDWWRCEGSHAGWGGPPP